MNELEWKVGDRLRILDATKIFGAESLQSDTYEVVAVHEEDGTPIIYPDEDGRLLFFLEEMPYVERVTDTEESERNTKLGGPPPPDVTVCNCGTLTEIHVELTDIKSMIGRLLKEGYEMAPVDDGGDAE